jgi:SPP1 gp7 family putative phage head morphogenesis protein
VLFRDFHISARRVDPTRTLTLRARYEREMVRRFTELKRLIREVIDAEDGFGLKTNAPKFTFPRDADKVSSFIEWLRKQVDRGILGTRYGVPQKTAASQSWQNIYLESAYQKGLADAAGQVKKRGGDVADDYMTAGFFRPVHADRAGLIYTRAYSDLKGITDAMDARMSRTLSQGLIEGRGVKAIARSLLDEVDISITRARTIARTEVIRAHAEASLNTYEQAGLESVIVEAEFATAQDNKVCPKCKAFSEQDTGLGPGIYDLKKARGLIPVHPNCRCAWIPIVKDPKRAVLR